MTNFKLFVKTQRIMWVKRLLYGEKNVGWKRYFDYSFRSVGGRFIFLCDYESSKLKLTSPPFYLEALKAWQDMNKFRNPTGEVMNPIIFNNRKVCINGKMIFDRELYNIGIYHVDHIVDKGHVKPVAHFQSVGIEGSDLLKILDIYNAMPMSWKEVSLSVKFQQIDPSNFNIVLNISGQETNFQSLKSRKIYDVFVKDLQESYSLQIRDGQNNFDFTSKEISDCFILPRNTTLVSKQREFQFKLLHGAMYTKEHLLKFGFVGDNLCSFCNKEPETYPHLFLHCTKVKELWQFIIEHFELVEISNMEWQDIFVGLLGNSNRIKCVNALIILLKYTIYMSRTSNLPPNVKICQIIRDFIEEEKNLAIKVGKLQLHLQKWETLQIN